mmetsp:Transcript_2867/g.8756  ORF Transcript_2867/g.8756 Transcript_2867/m.8756 type:complete len:229 (-) Transcript_2867:272-958(-)|eukprot:CAMPEP_0198728736 /NCGR_PEP_ID=MMETSP1475-20131203/11298_1 /TAXON_ID= ORGANISM="Unidentified sp., Strain CCMP1999" /NCGR_SAMPLE_ID=MMETSP1475 /ASSEMBLY_ACC=CAM_ASM_001111 /LENGTH=228 /DNA_ID=CAMNT_0044491183 /DNA_START=103 /DNA_END=789 /DNA_ORIENTATION=-
MAQSLKREVEELLQTQRYHPDIVPKLEKYVKEQCETGAVNSDANLALLKLYQFYPELHDHASASRVLALSLIAMPETDFLCAQYLIPSRFQTTEPIPKLTQLRDLLEEGKFLEFWKRYKTNRDSLPAVKNFEPSMRLFMLSVIKRTYINIFESDLMKLLNLEESELEELLKSQRLAKSPDGRLVKLPPTEENQPKAIKVTEQITFSQLAPMLFRAQDVTFKSRDHSHF